MTSKTIHRAMYGLAVLGAGLALAGCCKDAEKRAADAEAKLKTLERELPTLKIRLSEVEPKAAELESKVGELETCQADLVGAKAQLGLQEEEDALTEKRQATVKRLLDKLKGIIEAGDLSVRIRRGRMVLVLPSAVLFESGKADLSEKGKKTLDSVAEVLKEIRDREFQVAGHTDSDPVSEGNPFDTNWHLSTARAVAVVLYLREKGMPAKNLSAAGYARFQPVASNKTPKGKARNRRIEISLMPNLAELPDLSRLEKKLGLAEKPVKGRKPGEITY